MAGSIFYTHDVSDTPSEYGSTPAMLDGALSRVAAARIEVLPMREAVTVALGFNAGSIGQTSAAKSSPVRPK